MRTLRRGSPDVDWKAGLLLGLVTSTFSSVIVSLGSRRIGRDAPADWMELGSILLRRRAIRKEPRPGPMLAGLAITSSPTSRGRRCGAAAPAACRAGASA